MIKKTSFSMYSNPLIRFYFIYINDIALIVILLFVLVAIGGLLFTNQQARSGLALASGVILLIHHFWQRRSGYKIHLIEYCEVNFDTMTIEFKKYASKTVSMWSLSNIKYQEVTLAGRKRLILINGKDKILVDIYLRNWHGLADIIKGRSAKA